jgi:hypothetical protein
MSTTNYPNGLSSFGLPVVGSGSIPATSGQYIFVSSTTGSNGNTGLDATSPKATIAGAILQANASKGDVIVCLPGHSETFTAAAALTINKAGLYIVGLGTGALRPTLTWSTSTAAQMIVSSAQVTFDNFVFDFTGIDAIVAAISVTAVDVAFVNSTFITNSASAGVVLGILTAATATRFRFENNDTYGPATNSGTTTTAVIKHEVGIDYKIRNNTFKGKMTQAILNATTILGGNIDNNRFVIGTGTAAITMAAASTPFISNNRINVASGTAPVVAAAGFMAGNIYSAAAGVTAGTASTF